MLVSTILVAVLLFCVAVAILAHACRPMLRLNLDEYAPAARGRPLRAAEPEDAQPGAGNLIAALSEEERDGFFLMWESVREGFDTDPASTVVHADLLMSDLIDDYRGATKRRDGESGLLSRHELKACYCSAHEIAVRSKEEWVNPNELKRAMRLYTVLFDELLGIEEHGGAFPEDAYPVGVTEPGSGDRRG